MSHTHTHTINSTLRSALQRSHTNTTQLSIKCELSKKNNPCLHAVRRLQWGKKQQTVTRHPYYANLQLSVPEIIAELNTALGGREKPTTLLFTMRRRAIMKEIDMHMHLLLDVRPVPKYYRRPALSLAGAATSIIFVATNTCLSLLAFMLLNVHGGGMTY